MTPYGAERLTGGFVGFMIGVITCAVLFSWLHATGQLREPECPIEARDWTGNDTKLPQTTDEYICPQGGRHLGRISDGSWAIRFCLEPDEPVCPALSEHIVGYVYLRGMSPDTAPQRVRLLMTESRRMSHDGEDVSALHGTTVRVPDTTRTNETMSATRTEACLGGDDPLCPAPSDHEWIGHILYRIFVPGQPIRHVRRSTW